MIQMIETTEMEIEMDMERVAKRILLMPKEKIEAPIETPISLVN